ncbi:MAG: glycosyltransferase family 4 protein [Actinobacteria bacterium]|nr:glycosyltransferase family 4 protein [Actinomycetota bacterium]
MTARFGIDAEMLWESRPNGISTYLANVSERIGAADPASDYVLVYFHSLRRRVPPASFAPPDVPRRVVRVPVRVLDRLDRGRSPLRWELLAGRLHACLFGGRSFHPLRRGGNAGIVWDLTASVCPETMQDPDIATGWARRTERMLDTCDRVIVISESVKAELRGLPGYEDARVVVAPPGVDPTAYRPMSAADIDATLARLGVQRPYVLHVGAVEPRKNVARLVDAFANLSPALRRRFQLVVAGGLAWGVDETLAAIDRAGATGATVRHLNGVATADLPALYNGAALLAFPSVYEGYGLPVLEALACGTAVLTSDRSSLPEAAGGAAVLVDPTSTGAIAASLEAMLTTGVDEAARSRGLAHAASHTWERTAATIAGALHESADSRAAANR